MGRLEGAGEKSMKQGKETACAKGRGCEGAWPFKQVRVLESDEDELDAGFQKSTYPPYSVSDEDTEAQRSHDCQG